MHLLWLNHVVMILVDLSERCINELICKRCSNTVSTEEGGEELAELFAIQNLIIVSIELFPVSIQL